MGWRGFAVAVFVGCLNPFVPGDLTAFEPPAAYVEWWQETAECAGVTPLPEMSRIEWYSTPPSVGATAFECEIERGCAGIWVRPHAIVLSEFYVENEDVVMHEMLHDLLGAGGHPEVFWDCCLMLGYGGVARRTCE